MHREILALGLLFLLALPLSAFGQEIVIDKSPFGSASFSMLGNPVLDAGNGKEPRELEVWFSMVIKDIDAMAALQNDPEDGRGFVIVPWSALTIIVDAAEKGMSISYQRQLYIHRPRRVVLTVPSEQDKVVWVEAVRKKSLEYLDAYTKERDRILKEREAAEKTKQGKHDNLRRGPILVYPK